MSKPGRDHSAPHTAIRLDIRPPSPPGSIPSVSVIVPLAPLEPSPDALLAQLPDAFEVILARGGSRASSMNSAAMAAKGAHLWFVHADTVIDAEGLARLRSRLAPGQEALWYFDLRFDGGFAMRLTEFGVLFRSRVLGLPFGDQALCLPAATFREIGGYDEAAPYGEDHLLVWAARREGVPLRPVGHPVTTSARKYREHGWLRTTGMHLALTAKQALPAWLGLLRQRTGQADAGTDGRPRHR
jgi:hypothetical protein